MQRFVAKILAVCHVSVHDEGSGRDLVIRRRPAQGSESRLYVFESYAHHDERLRQELEKHLSPLRRSDLIETWHDARVSAGTEFHPEIVRRLTKADLILLLISPDFINSDFCYRREMRIALQRHAKGEARVVPVILRPVDWLTTPIGKLLATPKDARPVTTWQRRDEAFLDVATSIRRVAEDLLSARVTSQRINARPTTRGGSGGHPSTPHRSAKE
jgi:hypothetical protein